MFPRHRPVSAHTTIQYIRACAQREVIEVISIYSKFKSDVLVKEKCWFGHEAHIWSKAFLQHKPHKEPNIPSMPCSAFTKQTKEVSLSQACFKLYNEALYIDYRCKPDKTVEMEKRVPCVAESSHHVAALSHTALKCLWLPHKWALSEPNHTALLDHVRGGESRGKKNYGWKSAFFSPSALHVWWGALAVQGCYDWKPYANASKKAEGENSG